MAEIDAEKPLDLTKTVEHNPRVDAARATEFLDYVKKLQADGIDLKPRYGITRPFSNRPYDCMPPKLVSRNVPN